MKKHSLSYCAARWRPPPTTSCTLRSQKRWISLRHWDFSEAGQTTSTLADAGLAGQQLGRAHALDGLAQSHVVGQDRPARARGKGHALDLVRQQLDLQEFLAQGVLCRVLLDFRRPLGAGRCWKSRRWINSSASG